MPKFSRKAVRFSLRDTKIINTRVNSNKLRIIINVLTSYHNSIFCKYRRIVHIIYIKQKRGINHRAERIKLTFFDVSFNFTDYTHIVLQTHTTTLYTHIFCTYMYLYLHNAHTNAYIHSYTFLGIHITHTYTQNRYIFIVNISTHIIK